MSEQVKKQENIVRFCIILAALQHRTPPYHPSPLLPPHPTPSAQERKQHVNDLTVHQTEIALCFGTPVE